MFNTSIFDALNAQFFIKIYYLKSLKSVFRALVNISLRRMEYLILEFFLPKLILIWYV